MYLYVPNAGTMFTTTFLVSVTAVSCLIANILNEKESTTCANICRTLKSNKQDQQQCVEVRRKKRLLLLYIYIYTHITNEKYFPISYNIYKHVKVAFNDTRIADSVIVDIYV